MKATNYAQINAAIKLHLEYDKMTVGELSNIARQWQALLRAAWRESYAAERGRTAPNARVLTVAASTENSFELVSEYALPTLVFATMVLGPIVTWPGLARAAYARIRNRMDSIIETVPEGRTYMRVGDREVNLPDDTFADDETAERARRFLETLISGQIVGAIEDPDARDNGEDPDDVEEDIE